MLPTNPKYVYPWLCALLAFILFPPESRAGVTPNTLVFGDIEATVVNGTVIGDEFNGTIAWAGSGNTAAGPLTVSDSGGGVFNVTAGLVSLTFPQPYDPPLGNWTYNATGIALTATGASANVEVILPENIVYKRQDSEPFMREDVYDLGNIALDNDGVIKNSILLGGELERVKVRNEPFSIKVNGIAAFNDDNGFTLNNPVLEHDFRNEFATAPGVRPANAWWLDGGTFNGIVSVKNGGLNFEAENLTPADYDLAFPVGMMLSGAIWQLQYAVSEVSIGLLGADSVRQDYNSDSCTGGPPVRTLATGNVLMQIGKDWALFGSPDSSTGPDFNIVFDAYNVGPFKIDGTVYATGTKALGETTLTDHLPHAYLYAGRLSAEVTDLVFATYPEDAYTEGVGVYAGFNVDKPDFDGVPFSVQLACENAPFTSSNASKFYVRRGGFTGLLDASADSVAMLPPLMLYGEYETTLTKFNITLQDNLQWQDSAIDGNLDLPFPSDTFFEFTSLELDTCGSPGAAKIDTFENTLAYWNRDFKFRGLEFRDVIDEMGDPVESSCGTILRSLWTSSSNSVPELSKSLLVDTNFAGDGDILEAVITGELGNTLQEWPFTLRQMYYSAWDNTMNINGKTVLVGDMSLPFWGATPVVALYDSGSIPQVFDGRSYAQSPPVSIDNDRDGFPAGISTIQEYLDSEDWRPNVQASFANVIPLDYKVKYNNISRRFATAAGEEKGRDLVVLSINSSVNGITKDETDVRFAAEFGIPSISVSSLLEDLADPALQALLGPIKDNMNVVNGSLSGQLGEAIRGGMEDLTRPAVTQMVNNIRNAAANTDNVLQNADITNINNIIDGEINSLEGVLKLELSGDTGPIIGKIDQVLTGLENLTNQIEALDPSAVEDVLVALIELAGADPSGVQQVLGDVEEARNYIVEELINNQLRPVLEELRMQLDNLGTLPAIDSLIQGVEFGQAMTDVQNEIKGLISELQNNAAAVRNLDPEMVNTRLINTIYNAFFMQAVNQVVAELFEPLKQEVQNILNGFFDALNNQVKAYIDLIGGVLDEAAQSINDVTGVVAAKMSGYAVFGAETMDRLHIDADFSLTVPDEEFSFMASLDMERFKNNSNAPVCGTPVGAESIKVKIAVYGIPLRFPRSSLVAEQIALMLRLNQNAPDDPFFVSDVGGLIETSGSLNFEAVKVIAPSFAAGVGANEVYIAFSAGIVFNSVSMRGGIFLGRTCNGVEILESIDPEVGGLFTQNEITGIYSFGEAAIPIVDYTCMLRVGATAGAGFWYFVEGPSYGGKLTAGVWGEALCLVSVRGKIVLIGGKEAAGYFFKGTGWVGGGLGWCEPESWFTPDDVWADKGCATCLLWLEAIYQGGWSVDHSAECGL